MIIDAIVVVVELSGCIISIVVLEPVGKAVVIVVRIHLVFETIVVVVIAPATCNTVELVNVENLVVVIVRIFGIIHTIVVVVPGVIFSVRSLVIDVIDTVVIDV